MKIAAAELSKFGEVWFHYPDLRDASPGENSRYLAVSVEKGTWFRGQMERTAFTDAGVATYPIGADADGQVWYHEDPNGDDVSWSLRTRTVMSARATRPRRSSGSFPISRSRMPMSA